MSKKCTVDGVKYKLKFIELGSNDSHYACKHCVANGENEASEGLCAALPDDCHVAGAYWKKRKKQ